MTDFTEPLPGTEPGSEPDTAPDVENDDTGEAAPAKPSEDDGSTTDHGEED
jgi:hypothetical protein